LDEIHANVMALKEIAIDMDSELKKQNLMLDSIDKKVENTQAHLSNVNLKMKKAVDGVILFNIIMKILVIHGHR
jgi:t-SNARE complex subunit (syntaxin)